jgi:hypothetical protein
MAESDKKDAVASGKATPDKTDAAEADAAEQQHLRERTRGANTESRGKIFNWLGDHSATA